MSQQGSGADKGRQGSFLNYFTDAERGVVALGNNLKDRLFGWLGPLLVRLHISPDAVSYLGVACLVGVVIWFISHPYRAVGLIVLYLVIDSIDGAYARHLDRPTQSGAFTDIVCDQLGMVVVVLGFLQYGMLDGQVGAYYIMIYIVMIGFSVVQNVQGIPMQYIFRSKALLYGIYVLWAFTGVNIAPVILPILCVIMTVSVVQSFLRLKRGIYWRYDLPKIMTMDEGIRAEGGSPPRFYTSLNFILPAMLVFLLLFFGAFTQIRGMLESTDIEPAWKTSRPIALVNEKERPRALAAFQEGWMLLTRIPGTEASRVYLLDSALSVKHSFRLPWALHQDHGACTDNQNNLYIADRLSRRVFEVDIGTSMKRGVAALTRSFDTTLRAPVACVLAEVQGTRRMLVAEYMRHYKTLVVDYDKAFEEGSAEEAIVGWYRNMGFSRGLAADDTRVFEMNSSLWRDIIYVSRLDQALDNKYIRSGMETRIEPPCWHCRDMAIMKNTIAVLDPKKPRIFQAELPRAPFTKHKHTKSTKRE